MLNVIRGSKVSIEVENEKEVKIPDNDKWGSDQVQDIIPRLGIKNRLGSDPFIKPGKPFQPKTNISR